MNKKTRYSIYLSCKSETDWYHVYIWKDTIFKVIYNKRLNGVTIKVLQTKPKGLIKVKAVMPYDTPYSMMKNIIHCWKLSNYSARFKLIYPLVR